MDIRSVTVAGGGVLGSQIAFQSAYKGFSVTIWLRSEGSVRRAREKVASLHEVYRKALKEMADESASSDEGSRPGVLPSSYCRGLADSPDLPQAEFDKLVASADSAASGISFTTDLAEAFSGADLVIEAIAEKLDEKEAFYQSIQPELVPHTIVCTNSSTLPPSAMASFTGRPDRFLALHFANNIWRNNIAEVMGTCETSQESYRAVVEFARAIGMVPLELHKEQPGYLLNSMLVPFLGAAEALLANEVADAETIDAAWTLGTGAPLGPFRILDIVGLETAYNIVAANPRSREDGSVEFKIAATLLRLVDAGKTGVAAGEGFYKY